MNEKKENYEVRGQNEKKTHFTIGKKKKNYCSFLAGLLALHLKIICKAWKGVLKTF